MAWVNSTDPSSIQPRARIRRDNTKVRMTGQSKLPFVSVARNPHVTEGSSYVARSPKCWNEVECSCPIISHMTQQTQFTTRHHSGLRSCNKRNMQAGMIHGTVSPSPKNDSSASASHLMFNMCNQTNTESTPLGRYVIQHGTGAIAP